jgi:two-component system, chemotaxis family, sensor kinase CheA
MLNSAEILNLIFAPGFSTAEQVTNISGRGVGMDVVKRNIEALGGKVHISSELGKGSCFTVSLPLTLAILDGMIVGVGGENYIIPIANILETMKPNISQIREISKGHQVLNVRGEFISLVYLSKLFRVKKNPSESHENLVVLTENNGEKLGIVVDELVGQQQVVIKSIEQNSDPIDGIGGATILGDGKVSLILDIAKIQSMNYQGNNENLTELKFGT